MEVELSSIETHRKKNALLEVVAWREEAVFEAVVKEDEPQEVDVDELLVDDEDVLVEVVFDDQIDIPI
jgi:hypothetical protein